MALGLVLVAGLAFAGGGSRSGPTSVAGPAAARALAIGDLPPGGERSGSPGGADVILAESGCSFAERGFGDYGAWRPLPVGRVLVSPRAVRDDGRYDVLVHFHGAEPMRKELAPAKLDLVLVGVDLGVRSGVYEQSMASEGAFRALLASVDDAVARATERPLARARNVIVTSWSAGYGATAGVLARPEERVKAVVLLDSLYASYAGGKNALERGQLAGFVRAAKEAKDGGPFFVMTSTDVPTEGYASTAETADFVLREIGLTAAHVPVDPMASSPLVWLAQSKHFLARHYAGGGKEAHCDQLRRLLPLVRDEILPTFAW